MRLKKQQSELKKDLKMNKKKLRAILVAFSYAFEKSNSHSTGRDLDADEVKLKVKSSGAYLSYVTEL